MASAADSHYALTKEGDTPHSPARHDALRQLSADGARPDSIKTNEKTDGIMLGGPSFQTWAKNEDEYADGSIDTADGGVDIDSSPPLT